MEPQEMGEVLNEYFVSVFTIEKDLVNEESEEGCVDSLGHIEIKREEVLGVLKNIKVDKSSGPDGIYPRILREAREEIAGAWTEIFVSSLATGKVPEDWLIDNVVPLFKKGGKEIPANYRLVTLMSVVGKLLEKILQDRIYFHLEISGRISKRQHGFVKGRSCLTNLVGFFEEVTKMINEDRAVDVVYMDFSKAFDRVPPGRLVQKVKSHRVR
eukprot:g22160.t1